MLAGVADVLYLSIMKPRTPGLWIIAVIIGLLSQMPTLAFAGMTPEEVKSFEGHKSKAEKGDADAQFNLGVFYVSGRGVAKDEVEAVKWYRKAADQGLPSAQFKLGVCYENGKGVPKDEVQAISWYRKAADQGLGPAQFKLGVCYEKGKGVVKDLNVAYAYLSVSGIIDEDARYNLARIERQMSADQIADGKKRAVELQKEIDARIAAKTAEDANKAGK